jgi:DNA-binding MarR family transcriptional regulator
MTIDQRAAELGLVMEDIVKQFQTAHVAAACGPHAGLNHQELRVLELLGRDGPQMMRVLAEHLSLAVNSITTVIDGLEQKGFAARQRSDEDRRIVLVELTETGTEAYRALKGAKMQFFRSMLQPLTIEEQEIFLVLFRKIARVGRESIAQARSAG